MIQFGQDMLQAILRTSPAIPNPTVRASKDPDIQEQVFELPPGGSAKGRFSFKDVI